MKILNKTLPTTVILFIIAGILVGSSVAIAISPIWSNTTTSTITQKSWTGTVVLSNSAPSAQTGDSITLTATLNPLPSTYQAQQKVVFYFSTTPIALENGNPTDPSQLKFVGDSEDASSVVTVDGVAHLTFVAQTSGTFYFIAKIPTPT